MLNVFSKILSGSSVEHILLFYRILTENTFSFGVTKQIYHKERKKGDGEKKTWAWRTVEHVVAA